VPSLQNLLDRSSAKDNVNAENVQQQQQQFSLNFLGADRQQSEELNAMYAKQQQQQQVAQNMIPQKMNTNNNNNNNNMMNVTQPDNRDTAESDLNNAGRPKRGGMMNANRASASVNNKNIVKQEDSSMIEAGGAGHNDRLTIDGRVWMLKNDGLLMRLAIQYRCDWKKIAKRFNKEFTPYFLKMRYRELTSSKVHRKTKFTHKEDLLIAKYFDLFGTDWKRIAQYLKDRTGVMVKNRYYSFIRKRDCMKDLVKQVQDYEIGDKRVDDMASVDEDDCDGNNTDSPIHNYTFKSNVKVEQFGDDEDVDGEDDEDDVDGDDDEEYGNEEEENDAYNNDLILDMNDENNNNNNNVAMISKARTENSFFNAKKTFQHQQQQTSFSNSPEKKEIESLKEKVKSLEQLIIETQRELALVRNQQRSGEENVNNNNNNNSTMFY